MSIVFRCAASVLAAGILGIAACSSTPTQAPAPLESRDPKASTAPAHASPGAPSTATPSTRARSQSGAQPGGGRSQPRWNADQSSALRSLSQPGSSLQVAGIQRERARAIGWASGGVDVVTAGAGVAGSAGTAAGVAVGGRGSRLSSGAGGWDGVDEQPAIPRIPAANKLAAHRKTTDMWLILLEAFGALAVLVLIVWWTMFSGRRNGERK